MNDDLIQPFYMNIFNGLCLCITAVFAFLVYRGIRSFWK